MADEQPNSDSVTMAEIYAHIENGGVNFAIVDEGRGPTLVISSSHFGNNLHEQKYYLTKQFLAELGQMLLGAAKNEFTPEYCIPLSNRDREEGQHGCGHGGCYGD